MLYIRRPYKSPPTRSWFLCKLAGYLQLWTPPISITHMCLHYIVNYLLKGLIRNCHTLLHTESASLLYSICLLDHFSFGWSLIGASTSIRLAQICMSTGVQILYTGSNLWPVSHWTPLALGWEDGRVEGGEGEGHSLMGYSSLTPPPCCDNQCNQNMVLTSVLLLELGL